MIDAVSTWPNFGSGSVAAKSLVEGCARSPGMNNLSSKRPSANAEGLGARFDPLTPAYKT